MKTYQLKRTQFLPISQQAAWDFLSSPKNLGVITPTHINFKIISITEGDRMVSGKEIKYKVNILPLVRMAWISKITEVQEPDYFIDIQLSGPFTLWRHKHSFRTVDGGVEMVDELDYAVPLGALGRLANWMFVGQQVNTIFEYRNKILRTYFQNTNR